MKRLVAASLVVLWVLLTPGVAQAWVLVDQDRGWRRAHASGWTEDYREVHFYAGHARGVEGSFFAEWAVVCEEGFTFFRSATVRDTTNHFWGRIVRIPANEGRCDEDIRVVAEDPRNVRMTAAIEAR